MDMKVSRFFSVKERQTIKDCMRDYISNHMESSYDSEEKAYFSGKARIMLYHLSVITFKYRSIVTYQGKTTNKEISCAFTPDIIFNKPLPTHIENDVNKRSKSKVTEFFDSQWQLKKDYETVIVDNKKDVDIDSETLLTYANNDIESGIRSKGYAREKFEWRAELIEDSLFIYMFPCALIINTHTDVIDVHSRAPQCYNLAAEPNEYIPPKCNILSENEPVHKIEKEFNKYKKLAIIAGIAAFVFLASILAHWIFILLFFAALAGGGYFLYKALPYKPNGKLMAEEEKKAEERKADITKRVIEKEVEKAMKQENLYLNQYGE